MSHPELANLYARVRQLAHNDRRNFMFGAATHRWEGYQLPTEELGDAASRHNVANLPPDWVWWVTEGPGVGPGPFYGLLHPDDIEPIDGELASALPLSDHGCGLSDWLRTDAPHAGEVWVDLRESGGEISCWYKTFAGWLDAWLQRAFAEWGIAYLEDSVPPDSDPTFVASVRDALHRAATCADDPMLLQYPVPRDKAVGALGTLHLANGNFTEAAATFDEAAALSREPDAWRALGRCRIAKAQRDAEALLAAADEGLKAQPLWWLSEGQLLVHRVDALEALQRWDEGVAAREAVADHFTKDLRKNLDVVWVRMLRWETDLAVQRVRALADRGLGCDRDASPAEKLAQITSGLRQALRNEDMADRAEALEAALAAI